jgi:hypothetical protein
MPCVFLQMASPPMHLLTIKQFMKTIIQIGITLSTLSEAQVPLSNRKHWAIQGYCYWKHRYALALQMIKPHTFYSISQNDKNQ